MDKDALQFYLESKNDFSFRAEEKLAQEREEKVADTLKQVAVNFAKKNPDIATHAITGGILGGASELAMPSEIDAMGRPSTNMTQIGKRALLGATMGGIGSGVKQHVKSKIDKLAEDKEAGLKDLLKSPVGKGALIGGLGWGVPVGLNQYETSKKISQGKDLPTNLFDLIENPTVAGLAAGGAGLLTGGMAGAGFGKLIQKNPQLAQAFKEQAKKYIPSTLSAKEFIKDPITRNALIGGGGGIAAGLGQGVDESSKGKLEFDPHITRTLGLGLSGALAGAALGKTLKDKKSLDYLQSIADFVRGSKHKNMTKQLKAGVPDVIAKMKDGTEVLAKYAGIKDVAKNVYNKHPRSVAGGGLALLGGGLGYAGAKKKNKKEVALASAVGLGGLGVVGGSYTGAFNQALENSKRIKDLGKAVMSMKTANAFSPMLQRAGSLIAKNPRAASAALGAGTGLAANAVTGSDAPVFSAVAGGALGALGGKQLLRATVNRANPLLGKDVAQGAVGVMKQNRASQLALRSPKVVNMGATEAAASNLKGMSTPSPAGPRNVPVGNAAPAYSVKAQASNPASFTPTNQPKTSLTGVSFSPSATPAPTAQKADFMSAYRPTRSTANPSMNQARAAMPQTSYSPEMAQTLSKIAEIMKW